MVQPCEIRKSSVCRTNAQLTAWQSEWKTYNGNNKVRTAESAAGENAPDGECSHFWCHRQVCAGRRKSRPTFSCPGIWRTPGGARRQRRRSRPPPSPPSALTSSSSVEAIYLSSIHFYPLRMRDLVPASLHLFPWPLCSFCDSHIPYTSLQHHVSFKAFLFLGFFLFCRTAVSKAELALSHI